MAEHARIQARLLNIQKAMLKRRKSDIGPIDGDVGRGVPIRGKRDRRKPTGLDPRHIAGNDTSTFDDEREWSKTPEAAPDEKK